MRMRWRGLIGFWAVLLPALGGLGLGLQWAGPPRRPAPHPAAVAVPAPKPPASSAVPPPAIETPSFGRIEPPQAALLEPSPRFPGARLPRIAANGARPDQVYRAVPAPVPDAERDQPRIALLLTGLDLDKLAGEAALIALPGPVSIAVSPYVSQLDDLLRAARAHGHEILLSIPMEPEDAPVNEEGFRALSAGARPAQNAENLEWSLGRVEGYAGATGALGGLRGRRFAADAAGYAAMRAALAARGLFYVDPRAPTDPGVDAGAAPGPVRAVDRVIDDSPIRKDLDAELQALEALARKQGGALALAGPLHPVTLDWLAEWARGLRARGLRLVPASALAPPVPTPTKPPAPEKP